MANHSAGFSQANPENDAQKPASEIQPLEWAVAIFGAGLVIATLVYLVYVGIDAEQSPPDLQVTVQEMVALDSGYLVEVDVFNRGEQAAAGAIIEGVLRDGDTDVETSQMTLDYVPSGSLRGGGLYFSNDPNDYELVLRAKGYQQP